MVGGGEENFLGNRFTAGYTKNFHCSLSCIADTEKKIQSRYREADNVALTSISPVFEVTIIGSRSNADLSPIPVHISNGLGDTSW